MPQADRTPAALDAAAGLAGAARAACAAATPAAMDAFADRVAALSAALGRPTAATGPPLSAEQLAAALQGREAVSAAASLLNRLLEQTAAEAQLYLLPQAGGIYTARAGTRRREAL